MRSFKKPLTAAAALLGVACFATSAFAQCKITETTKKLDGAEHQVFTLENERISIDVVPDLTGRLQNYVDKTHGKSALEWLDDCPYSYGGRWEGKPFTYHIDDKGPDHASITVKGGGKIAVAMLRSMGLDVSNPLSLECERTMSVEHNSTRVKIDVKVTNVGEGVASQFRYMIHAVYGQVPVMKSGRAYWFLPTEKGVQFFNEARGNAEMWTCSSGAPLDHPFSRFNPGHKADKPRYDAGGWGAMMTSVGPAFISYDPDKFNFMQYWFGGDAEWHFTFEPNTKPIELKPGESMTCTFTLALDPNDVPFKTATTSFALPEVGTIASPGSTLEVSTQATTVTAKPEHAKLTFEVKDPAGKTFASQDLQGDVKSFEFTPMSMEIKIPADAALGNYTWTATTADGKLLSNGKFEVMTAAVAERRKTELAQATLRAEMDTKVRELSNQVNVLRNTTGLWVQGVDVALEWNNPLVWPESTPTQEVQISLKHNAIPVYGHWKENEAVRINNLAGLSPRTWPLTTAKQLAALGPSRDFVRDLDVDIDGKTLVALIVEPGKNRVQISRIAEAGNVTSFGQFADHPGETDPTLGVESRKIAVDNQGNIWVATNAWGQTSVYRVNQDGSPYEESVIGAKGALRKYSPTGNLITTIGLLDAPMDMTLAKADGTDVLLVSYRGVSSYHGAQVREGVMVVNTATGKRMNDIKIPAGSVTIDSTGKVWSADVAGHVAVFDTHGGKLFDVPGTPDPAVPDAKLPAGSPLPMILRQGPSKGVYALSTFRKKLSVLSAKGPANEQDVPAATGGLWSLLVSPTGPVVLGDKDLFAPVAGVAPAPVK